MLLGINDQRKAWTERVWREADQTYRNTPGWAQANCAVVYGYWPMGILGIVANKFIDKYQVPSFLITDRKKQRCGVESTAFGRIQQSTQRKCAQSGQYQSA